MGSVVDALTDPSEESRRMAALEGGILDDDLDDALQRLVREAADELRAPIALASAASSALGTGCAGVFSCAASATAIPP